jgi:hypothetical protein
MMSTPPNPLSVLPSFPRMERSLRFASSCPFLGYAGPTTVRRSFRYPSSAFRRLLCRPYQWQFSCPTRRDAVRPTLPYGRARKTQSA